MYLQWKDGADVALLLSLSGHYQVTEHFLMAVIVSLDDLVRLD